METMIEFIMGFSTAFLPALVFTVYHLKKKGKETTRLLEKKQEALKKQLEAARQEVISLKKVVAETQQSNIQLSDLKETVERDLQRQKKSVYRWQRKAKRYMSGSSHSGYVYVISAPELLGENHLLIRATDELRPAHLLGEVTGQYESSASFEVHGVFFHDKANELEASLWKALENHKVQRVELEVPLFAVSPEVVKSVMSDLHELEIGRSKRSDVKLDSSEGVRVVFRNVA